MSIPKIIRATRHLFFQIHRLTLIFTKRLIRGLLRSLLAVGRRRASSRAGFVLPTTVLLLLVVTLTVGAIGYRTFTRTQQTIGARQQRVIYNAATPAIDRAKAKLEFLFDPQLETRGGGVPSQDELEGMMLNDGSNGVATFSGNKDPYTIPRETRVDINGDGEPDNAWTYRADLDGDGTEDGTVAYSIIFTSPGNEAELRTTPIAQRALKTPLPWIRNAPLSNASKTAKCDVGNTGGGSDFLPINGDGWFPDQTESTKLRKNFQVDAYVLPDNPNGTVATLEFQQDREATQGFRWAAWFRNDLEIFPGQNFNWNGAMHTEGSFFVSGRNPNGQNSFTGFMISSPASCLYDESSSEISVADHADDGTAPFRGQFITGTIRDNNYDGAPVFHIFTTEDDPPITDPGRGTTMTRDTDSLNEGNLSPAAFALDPVVLQTQDISRARGVENPVDEGYTDPDWRGSLLARRLIYDEQDIPYVDDTFRADDRYGPKPVYGRDRTPIPGVGREIEDDDELVDNSAIDSSNVGLDGYWERRARRDGLRLIVGQRLELGDPAGWGGPNATSATGAENEPLKPWENCVAGTRCNEARQRKTLWDNLAAVQATAVYHRANDPDNLDFPAACIATTVHPGTAGTLDRSATFENLAYFGSGLDIFDDALPAPARSGYDYDGTGTSAPVISDFFRGRGTNGWQFAVPPEDDFSDADSPLMTALNNLALFAGDPRGGAPSFPPVQDNDVVHPYPNMAMWGDFSMLRRVLDSGKSYSELSPADKTVLHTAGCTIGMLAYNVDYLEKLSYAKLGITATPPSTNIRNLVGYTQTELAAISKTNPTDAEYRTGLRGALRLIRNRADVLALEEGTQRLPNSISQLIADPASPFNQLAYSPTASEPEAIVRLLERWRDDPTVPATDPTVGNFDKEKLNQIIYLAQLIITKEQVARDRFNGFADGILGRGNNVPASDTEENYARSPVGKCRDWRTAGLDGEPLFALCSARAHYPILHSLFPARFRFNSASPLTSMAEGYANSGPPASATGFHEHLDFTNSGEVEDRISRDFSDNNANAYITSANSTLLYEPVRPQDVATPPLLLQGVGYGPAWTLPTAAAETGNPGNTPNSNEFNYIKLCDDPGETCSRPGATPNAPPEEGKLVKVPFKDAAFFNGRELMSVRTLDIDLDLLRNSAIGDDYYLPKQGIVYAYREDAISEAHIVRPRRTTWGNCDTDAEIVGTDCRMRTNVSALTSTDPPLNPRQITPKPVDYYPDPDRRPNGFRLRNGATVKRGDNEENKRGLSFITDNPAYIQGYFNLHRPVDSTNLSRADGLEEFRGDDKLDDDFGDFYERVDLDIDDFSRTEEDDWRPSEIVADAVTLLSPNFCDGSIEDGILTAGQGSTTASIAAARVERRYGCEGSGTKTSYLSQSRPTTNPPAGTKGVRWQRTNLADSLPALLPDSATEPNPQAGESPIFISRNGAPIEASGTAYAGAYYPLSDNKENVQVNASSGVQMNMIMVSGIVPSRPNQSYGGLHNFPRFIENWKNDDMFISGAFLQLNFSTYATGPYDQDAWEVGTLPTTGTGCEATGGEWRCYYEAPNRRWGYDVGLQYAAPGPVAERFRVTEATRSEFYSEPPADDPYIKNLRCVVNTQLGRTSADCDD